MDEDDFDGEDDDDEDDDDMGEDDDMDDLGDEDGDDMDEDEPVSKKSKAVLGKAQAGNAKAAGQVQNAKSNKQQEAQAKPLRQAQKANQKAESVTTKPAQKQKQPEKANAKPTGAAGKPAATAKKPSVPTAFAPGRGAAANQDPAENKFWEAAGNMRMLSKFENFSLLWIFCDETLFIDFRSSELHC